MKAWVRNFFIAGWALIAGGAAAQEEKTRQQLVLEDVANFEDSADWIYNDLEEAAAAARGTGKPLLVVHRCVPCRACSEFDQQVAGRVGDLKTLMDKFVCARVIQANSMDLTKFQFDYDMSFGVTFLNADGTVYGRFGTRSAIAEEEADRDMSLEGLKATLEAVLALHEGYPGNRELLLEKNPRPAPRARPEEFPGLGKYPPAVDFAGQPVASCLHCHQIQEALRLDWRERGHNIPGKTLFPFPMPEVVGFSMDPRAAATVRAVKEGSPAGRSGLHAGDVIETAGGMAIVSTADLQWVLHHASDPDEVSLRVLRDGARKDLKLALESGWRKSSDISWRVSTWDLRRMVLGGMFLEALSAGEREKMGVPDGKMALRARHVGEYGEHAVALNAGLRKGDVVVRFDGSDSPETETLLIARLLERRKAGSEIEVEALREGERLTFRFKTQ